MAISDDDAGHVAWGDIPTHTFPFVNSDYIDHVRVGPFLPYRRIREQRRVSQHTGTQIWAREGFRWGQNRDVAQNHCINYQWQSSGESTRCSTEIMLLRQYWTSSQHSWCPSFNMSCLRGISSWKNYCTSIGRSVQSMMTAASWSKRWFWLCEFFVCRVIQLRGN